MQIKATFRDGTSFIFESEHLTFEGIVDTLNSSSDNTFFILGKKIRMKKDIVGLDYLGE